MAKLTRLQRRQLESALGAAQRAQAYVMDPRTIIATVRSAKTTTLDFDLPDGRYACEVKKAIGSNMAGLFTTVSILRELLNETPA